MPDKVETVVRYAEMLRRVAESHDVDASFADAHNAMILVRDAAALRALAALCERAEKIQGCGDHSCLFSPPAHGLGTNGGCRCRNNPRIVPLLAAIHAGYREGR